MKSEAEKYSFCIYILLMVVRTDRVRKLEVILVSDFDRNHQTKTCRSRKCSRNFYVLISSHPMSSVPFFFWLLVSKKIQMSCAMAQSTESPTLMTTTPTARFKIHKIKTAIFFHTTLPVKKETPVQTTRVLSPQLTYSEAPCFLCLHQYKFHGFIHQ